MNKTMLKGNKFLKFCKDLSLVKCENINGLNTSVSSRNLNDISKFEQSFENNNKSIFNVQEIDLIFTKIVNDKSVNLKIIRTNENNSQG